MKRRLLAPAALAALAKPLFTGQSVEKELQAGRRFLRVVAFDTGPAR